MRLAFFTAVVSIFDIFKIAVGPSSSHTLGPWRACLNFLKEIQSCDEADSLSRIQVDLYGSLALTGKGHGTDLAVVLGLSDFDPATVNLNIIAEMQSLLASASSLPINKTSPFLFCPKNDIVFHLEQLLDFHSNALKCSAYNSFGILVAEETYYSIGGGFIIKESEKELASDNYSYLYQFSSAKQLLSLCRQNHLSIKDVVLSNELKRYTEKELFEKLGMIWEVMRECAFRGSQTEGILPGGLNVRRRAAAMSQKLLVKTELFESSDEWLQSIKSKQFNFRQTIDWVSCFALAVNEENASFGRVVTAPTNGAAGVIPAVILYVLCLHDQNITEKEIFEFLLVAAAVGSLFKEGATLSAAAGGCQAEIGVSSAMAAAGLVHVLGGTDGQILMAAEIAMEHHLGLTCDPIMGLVQVPCIERNSIGAMKAITSAQLALNSDPEKAKVSLDQVIKTMWNTALDMNLKYKETAQGGLAIHVAEAEC